MNSEKKHARDDPPDNLAGRYLSGEERSELQRKGDPHEALSGGVLALLLGCALIALGFYLTRNSRWTVYFGPILVGVAIVAEGTYCVLTQTEYKRLSPAVRVVAWIVGIIATLVFVTASIR
jgi:hypothetical protein